jgi:signal transduction histidine kinase
MFRRAVKTEIQFSSLVLHFLALVLFFAAAGENRLLSRFTTDFLVLLAASFSLSVAGYLSSRQWIIGMALVIRVFVLMLISIPFGDNWGVKAILLLALVMESIFLLKTPRDYIFAPLAITLFLVGQRSYNVWGFTLPGPSLAAKAVIAVLSLGVLLFCATMKRLLLKVELGAKENARLTESNIRLTDTNLEFQEAFLREEAELVREERKRIAREVHDSIAYVLTNLIMMMENAMDLHASDDVRLLHHLQTTRDHAQKGLIEIRQAIKLLRDRTVTGRSDIAEIFVLAGTFEKASHITVDINIVSHEVMELEMTDKVTNTLFRLIQESMTNAVRHGRATRILVSIDYQEGELHVSISDNGTGSKEIIEGFGILGMKERLAELNGRIDIMESPQGFALTARLPVGRRVLDEADSRSSG